MLRLSIRRDLVTSFILGLFIFSFIIDSGGPIGVRLISFMLMFFYCLPLFCTRFLFYFRYFKLNICLLIGFIVLLLLALYSLLVSTLNYIDFQSAITWLIPFISFPLFVFLFSTVDDSIANRSLVVSGWLFSLTISFTFILLLVFSDAVTIFFKSIDFPGWFYIRGDGYPQVYFQATLCLVVISVFSFLNGYKLSSIFFCLCLLLCLSRFGFFVVVLTIILSVYIKPRQLAIFSYWLFWFLFVIFIPLIIIIFLNSPGNIDYSTSSGLIRFGHLHSIYSQINEISFLVGSGPGSLFFSSGINNVTNNIEVSQLEVFRKYGLIGYIMVNSFFLFVQKTLINRHKYTAQIALVAFYIVSYSNPVLLTFMLSVFIGVFFAKNKGGMFAIKT